MICRIKCANPKLLKKITHNLKKGDVVVEEKRGADEQIWDENIKNIQIVLLTASTTKIPGFLKPFFVYYTGNEEMLFFEIIHHLFPSAWTEEACAYFVEE